MRTPRAGTRADACTPTALAGGVDTQSWRGGNTANDASTSDTATIPIALAVGVDTQSRRKHLTADS